MATILVTGGAGYVGSHTCKALAVAGHRPVAYDNLSRGHDALVKWGPLEVGDITDAARLHDVMVRHRPDAVMHFAALALVEEFIAKPKEYERTNVGGTRCLVDAMAATGVGVIVVSSSCAVYGTPTSVPITEDAPCMPINPYGHSKLLMERVLAEAEAKHGVRWAALRYFNAAGADPQGETGEWHDPEPHLIPRVLDVAAGKGDVITIHGDDYPTPDGTCIRDYIHVSDLADAHVRALDYAAHGDRGTAFNLGTGAGHSVRDVIETVRAVTGKPVAVKIGVRRPGDPPVLVADAQRARAVLGWIPRFADLTSQIATAWAWHQRRADG